MEKRRINDERAVQSTAKEVRPTPSEIPPNYRDMEMILFPEGSILDANNSVIPQSHLRGKSVGLYFARASDPRCAAFLPFLLNFYRRLNEGGSNQKIEIIFVSMDENREAFEKHRANMPWLSVDFENPLTVILRRHFRVVSRSEIPTYGYGSATGIPSVIIIGSDGHEAQILPVSSGREEGERALMRWDWRNTRFDADRFLVRQEAK